jgi:hypothetical protein
MELQCLGKGFPLMPGEAELGEEHCFGGTARVAWVEKVPRYLLFVHARQPGVG